MAIALEYSTDRGANWTALSVYTHPSSAGVYHERINIGGIVQTTSPTLRFRLTGTDAASWGLIDWKLEAPVSEKREQDLV